ncbi:Calcium-binding protein [Sphingomonas sp. EC-HK361]|uniref:EF-hand domain-containing protein n=1 Tax=Sphingomonas sp. EC-HK361 TaxID=2038397 RepID=UPI0012520177|nr:EF-hand domain-containing protein [Sphingomonas sp. EC-HK361]VVS97422.1 Calcium-binding protein [Sphingomonas sp. EC-HK361]
MLLFVLAQVTPVAPPAIPQLPPATMVVEPAGMLIAACDSDGDGKTTRAELTSCVKRGFDAIDSEHKGSIGYIGFADWAERWLGDRNALPSPFETDADGDNRITLGELEAKMAEIFARLDRDHDGAVTRAELLTIRASGGDRDPRRGKRR